MTDFSRIDFLVNNAAVHDDAEAVTLSNEAWDKVIRICLSGVFDMTRAVLPHMITAGFGRIVNITWVAASKGSASQSDDAAAKAGVQGFSWSLHVRLLDSGSR